MKNALYAAGTVTLVILLAFLLKVNHIDCLVTLIAYCVLSDRLEKENER